MHLTNKKFKIKNRQVKKDKGKLILSKNISVSLNDKSTNVCIIGGSGSQKTYAFTEPNLTQASSSYLVADRFLKTYNKFSQFLRSLGYGVRLIDMAEVENSKEMADSKMTDTILSNIFISQKI